jgi:hypothetical protein
MRLRREAAILKKKAVFSLRRALGSFNSYDDDGCVTDVLQKLAMSVGARGLTVLRGAATPGHRLMDRAAESRISPLA